MELFIMVGNYCVFVQKIIIMGGGLDNTIATFISFLYHHTKEVWRMLHTCCTLTLFLHRDCKGQGWKARSSSFIHIAQLCKKKGGVGLDSDDLSLCPYSMKQAGGAGQWNPLISFLHHEAKGVGLDSESLSLYLYTMSKGWGWTVRLLFHNDMIQIYSAYSITFQSLCKNKLRHMCYSGSFMFVEAVSNLEFVRASSYVTW